MRDKHQKKLQKEINTVVRNMNKNIYNDNLWLGRFYGHQIRSRYYKFPDNSGGILTAWIELIDKKTYHTKIIKMEHCGMTFLLDWDLFKEMNIFIVEDCDVWADDPYNNIIDYREVKNE